MDMVKKRETVSQLTVAQNNAIRTSYVKTEIDDMQQNSKCRLCGENMKPFVSEYSKLIEREYKMGHFWVGKVIHW